MKNKLKYFLFLVTSVVIISCDKQLPTELISEDPETVVIEPIAVNPDEIVYSNGFDSTGFTSEIPLYSSVINISFSKTSSKLLTYNTTIAQAYFFDKTKPVKIYSGKTIGYRTKTPGTVVFGKKKARTTEHRIKYKDQGAVKDTSLGDYYILYKRGKSGDPFDFVHGAIIEFELRTESGSFPVDISTPTEINGELEVSGSRERKNLEVNLKWNKSGEDSFSVILGGIEKGKKEVIPYFKLTETDNGHFKIPFSFLKNFPFEKFDKLVFTLIRKKVIVVELSSFLGDSYIAARSIHNIQLDIPK